MYLSIYLDFIGLSATIYFKISYKVFFYEDDILNLYKTFTTITEYKSKGIIMNLNGDEYDNFDNNYYLFDL